MSLRTSCVGILALLGVGMLAAPASANLITNGDFQTGDASGWAALAAGAAVVADAGPAGVGDYALHIQSGDWTGVTAANNSNVIGGGQNGATFTVSFDYKVDPASTNDSDLYFQKAWGGNYPAFNFHTGAGLVADGQWHTAGWTFVATDDGGFRVGVYDNGGGTRSVYLDNLQVSVPEPTSMALLGLAGVALLHRRRA